MAQTSYPLPPNRVVTDANYENLTHPIGPDGIVGQTSDTSVVYGDSSGMQVKIRANKLGHVRGFAWESGTTDFTKTVTSNSSGSTRVDLVVLRLDRSTWAVTVEVRAGSPGNGAPAPVQDATMHEVGIAQVTVPSGAATISAGNVKPVEQYIAEQTLVCTSDNRPPHRQGRRIWESDTARSYISTGTGGRWLIIADDSGNAALQINTSLFVGTHYNLYRRNGWAFAELTASRPGGQLNANTVYKMATVPAGYRPPFLFQFAAVIPSVGQVAVGSIATNGDVSINPGSQAIAAGKSIVCALGAWPVLY